MLASACARAEDRKWPSESLFHKSRKTNAQSGDFNAFQIYIESGEGHSNLFALPMLSWPLRYDSKDYESYRNPLDHAFFPLSRAGICMGLKSQMLMFGWEAEELRATLEHDKQTRSLRIGAKRVR